MEKFKFEMIRSNESEEIMHCVSTRFEALDAREIVSAFVDFVSGCGFHRDSIIDAFEYFAEEREGV